ncbi:hypothetical protein AVEN_182194-1 [Araneus ventricosus]|uniref:Uncharacterized protein n=1 Tax=Araneus ventricosus TaxID=182803 RepID=A0A4Y2E3Z6_ARAVE|nr:hypothetical protein AVEN_182194-1 [Araneus ventricosus]
MSSISRSICAIFFRVPFLTGKLQAVTDRVKRWTIRKRHPCNSWCQEGSYTYNLVKFNQWGGSRSTRDGDRLLITLMKRLTRSRHRRHSNVFQQYHSVTSKSKRCREACVIC